MLDEPVPLDLPESAGAPIVEHTHHLGTGGWGALAVGAIVEVAHSGMSSFTMLCSAVGLVCVVTNTWLNWRTSEARLGALKTKLFREWDSARDRRAS